MYLFLGPQEGILKYCDYNEKECISIKSRTIFKPKPNNAMMIEQVLNHHPTKKDVWLFLDVTNPNMTFIQHWKDRLSKDDSVHITVAAFNCEQKWSISKQSFLEMKRDFKCDIQILTDSSRFRTYLKNEGQKGLRNYCITIANKFRNWRYCTPE